MYSRALSTINTRLRNERDGIQCLLEFRCDYIHRELYGVILFIRDEDLLTLFIKYYSKYEVNDEEKLSDFRERTCRLLIWKEMEKLISNIAVNYSTWASLI